MSVKSTDDEEREPVVRTFTHYDTVVFYDTENPDGWIQIDDEQVVDLEEWFIQ